MKLVKYIQRIFNYMETNFRITKTKDSQYYISVKEYRFYLFPYWKKLTTITDSSGIEEVMIFDTKEDAKRFLDYIYII